MFLLQRRCASALSAPFQLRRYTQSAAAALVDDDSNPESFPRPELKYDETILAVPRLTSCKSIAAKEQKAGPVPDIIFEQEDGQHGGNKRLISFRTNQIRKLLNHLGRSFFLSRLFHLEVRSDFDADDVVEKVRVLPRLIHLHSSTDAPLNVTFIRAPSNALLKVEIPLVFRGDDISPGLKKGNNNLQNFAIYLKNLCSVQWEFKIIAKKVIEFPDRLEDKK
ncbi:putative ribosomal L25/Gln-tRNA synthetase, anti-codon-binding protein [Rosa chinensis]|uniref:Putative ribosomal L25/Gln-tRNA synthetase, anti-codon-binding protein n=1 Tax=Rosa chinensis TaxID=74649 RepID=A0A2P6QUT8_ROSCH|nr:50S ribosomal protein L25 [Rosa chinensis]PRQ37945.1 putative ribosomal L25/Gln-tRNA synthetase, anti-codon-binding protein [Rosa chinensis]